MFSAPSRSSSMNTQSTVPVVITPNPMLVVHLDKPAEGFTYKVTTNPDGSLTIESVETKVTPAPVKKVQGPSKQVTTRTTHPRPVKRSDASDASMQKVLDHPYDRFDIVQPEVVDNSIEQFEVNLSSIDISDDGDVTIYVRSVSYYVHFADLFSKIDFIQSINGKPGVAEYFDNIEDQYSIELKLNSEDSYDFVGISNH
jgi:hypothetical protein